nr:MAG TPA: hypothetical protein [Caudoviricetes sp.]
MLHTYIIYKIKDRLSRASPLNTYCLCTEQR